VSLNGMSDTGPTTAAADAPLAKDKETPTTPNAGATSFRRLRVEACFVLGILQSSKPFIMLDVQRRFSVSVWQATAAWSRPTEGTEGFC
jgi:hypothetical protein